MMEQSRAYSELVKQINAKGFDKKDGYDPDTLDEIYDEERDEAEKLIVKAFYEDDSQISVLLPKLRNYNGIEMLQNEIPKCKVPSGRSINIASVLYKATGNESYLKVLERNIEVEDEYARTSVLSTLLDFEPSQRLFEIFEKYCVSDSSDLVKTTAARGLLYCQGYIKKPYSIIEVTQSTELNKLLTVEDVNQRKYAIMLLKQGKLETLL